MKLVRLYSNDNRFKTVKFSSGFNLILGKVVDEKNFKKDCHNLGKSRLIELIDFMLLKEIKKGSFLKKDQFKRHIFFLEIELNSGKYLTIKRALSKNTKISFKISKTKNNNFVNEINWDYKDLPLTSKEPNSNPKNILQSLLGFNVLENVNYRNYLNYFLRTQNDYSDEFHLSKYSGSDSEWKPLLFELLGFNRTPLKEKYSLDKNYQNQKEYISKLENKLEIDNTQIDKLRGLIQIKESEKEKLENALSKFNFYINDKNINKNLVDEIENRISKLNTIRYNLEIEITSLNNSIERKVAFDLDSTLQIFNEVKIYFSDQLKKSYEELLEFNKMITTDRNKHIVETLQNKKNELEKIDLDLKKLNETKKELLETLTETDIFKKYKEFERELIKIERDLEKYSTKLDDLLIIDNEIESLESIAENIEKAKKSIKSEVDSSNDFYKNIRNCFSEYVQEILDKPGLLSISQNTNGNVEFSSEIYDYNNALTAQGDGHSYKKILCACFDLALSVNYSKKSFLKFIFHDGCLETLDPRKQKKYLDLIQNLCDKYNIQYILTLIESDIPTISGKKYILPSNCNIAVELSDEDDTTNLFGFTF